MKLFHTFLMSLLIGGGAILAQERDEIAVELSPVSTIEDLEMIEVSDEFVRAAKFATRYFALGDPASAYERLQEANSMLPNHPAILYNMAVVLVKMGRYAEAEETITSYLALHPDGDEASFVKNLQVDLAFQKDLQKRQQSNQNYIELFNRGKYAYEQGEYEKALTLFQQTEQLRPEDAAGIYNQALAHEALGNYTNATERLRHYLAVSHDTSSRAEIDRKIFQLESEIQNTRSSFVCPFCGLALPIGATWCHRCWHGPYLLDSPRLNTLPCGVGASATRATFYVEDRLAKNEALECRIEQPNFLEQVRYSRGRQRAIQQLRKSEGWGYRGDVITGLEQNGQLAIELVQGDSLEYLLSRTSSDALTYAATRRGERDWLLDREEIIIDGRTYVKRYQYDADGRIAGESVTYRNDDACGHVIETTATYVRQGERLVRVDFKGGNTGFSIEGEPKTTWSGTLSWTYDDRGRISRELFEIESYGKTYKERPRGPIRNDVKRLYPQLRPGRTMDIKRNGDRCGMVGNRMVGNEIDLRPFHSIAPNVAILIPLGIVKVSIDYTYPASFELPKLVSME